MDKIKLQFTVIVDDIQLACLIIAASKVNEDTNFMATVSIVEILNEPFKREIVVVGIPRLAAMACYTLGAYRILEQINNR
jgi:hypothetical protein